MIFVHSIFLPMSNAFLIEYQEGLVLVDAGIPGDARRILAAVHALGKPLRLVFITHAHFDHYGAANAVRAQTGAPLAIHTADAVAMSQGRTPIRRTRARGRLALPFLPLLALWRTRLQTLPDLVLQDGDILPIEGLSASLLHTPGHTRGSSCLLLAEDGQAPTAAFAGDLVTAGRKPALQRLYADDWVQMQASLARLKSLNPAQVYCAHGHGPIPGEVLQKIRE